MPSTPLHHFSARTRLIVALAVVLALLVGLGTIVSRASDQKDDASRRVERAHSTIALVRDAYLSLLDMQTGYRGYLLTGDAAYLAPLSDNQERFTDSLAVLSSAPDTSADQAERWREIDTRHASWQREIVGPALALRGEVNAGRATLADVEAYVANQGGIPLFESIRQLFDEVLAAENARLDRLTADGRDADAMFRRNLIIGTAVAALLIIASGAWLALDNSRTSGRLARSSQALPTVHPAATAGGRPGQPENGSRRTNQSRVDDVEQVTAANETITSDSRSTAGSLGITSEDARPDQAWLRAVLDGISEGVLTFDSLGYVQTFSRRAEIIFGRSADAAVGCHVNDLLTTTVGTDPGWLGDEDWLGQRREMLAQRPNGSMIPVEITVGPVNLDQTSCYLLACRDISEWKRAQREAELLERVRHVSAREVDLDEMVGQVANAAATTFDYPSVRVYLREGRELQAIQPVDGQPDEPPIVVGNGPIGRCVVTGTTVLVSSPTTHDDASIPEAAAADSRSLVAVPLHDEDRVIGVLAVERPGWDSLDASDVALVEKLGVHLEIAISRARLYGAVRESDTRFAAFMGNSPTLAWMKDEDLRYVYVNDRFTKLMVQNPADVVGQDDFALWPAETAALLQANDRTVLRANRPLETHEDLPTFGDPKTFLTFRFPFHDSDGRRFVGGVAVDVSEHREAELELERQYREADHARSETNAILDATSEAILLVSPDDRVITVNRRFGELLGLEPAAAIGRDVASLQAAFDRIFIEGATVRDLLVRTHAEGDPRAKHVFTQQWPEHRELELYSTMVRDVGGELLGRLTVFRDVTRERAVDRMKTEFVALVSHELRTPLTSIKGYVDLLLDGEVGELEGQQRDFLEVVSNNVERQVTLINDLLDISTMESGKIVLNQAAVDLTHAIQSVSWAMAPQIERKGQRLMLDVPNDLPDAWGDRSRILQILTNLVSNAHKYTPKGGLIQIAAERQDELVRVDVRDSGIGMTPDEQAQLFNKFFRAKNRTTDEVGGTGLGLVITRALVDMQGGSMEVVSAPGKGSVFSFTLPLVTEDGVPSISPEDAASARSRRLTSGTGRLTTSGLRWPG